MKYSKSFVIIENFSTIQFYRKIGNIDACENRLI